MFWYSWPSFLVLKLHYLHFIGGDNDPEVVWLASCNNANEWQIQRFERSTTKTSNPCPQAHVLLLKHAHSSLLCAILHASFHTHSKIMLKKYTTAIISTKLKHRLQCQDLLCTWIILSGLCTDSQSRNGLSSYQAIWIMKEDRQKTDSTAKRWLTDHLWYLVILN